MTETTFDAATTSFDGGATTFDKVDPAITFDDLVQYLRVRWSTQAPDSDGHGTTDADEWLAAYRDRIAYMIMGQERDSAALLADVAKLRAHNADYDRVMAEDAVPL